MLGFIRLVLLGFLSLIGIVIESAEFEVLRVDFELVRQDGASDPWYEVVVVVSVEKGESIRGANPCFADDVTVSLAFATDVSRGGGKSYEFYAYDLEYPTLEVGQHAVRFYLPPELVKRDRVRGEPFAYEIEVLSKEEPEVSMVSRNLQSVASLQSFRDQVVANASVPSELLPQYRTPFAWSYAGDTPNPRLKR